MKKGSQKKVSRKDAKAQRRIARNQARRFGLSLCAFASLRETLSSSGGVQRLHLADKLNSKVLILHERRLMRFQFYSDEIANVPKLSVDGTVANSIHFSHWEGNETPEEVKADTSTEIALNLVTSPNRESLTQGIDLVTNNHFDTDGMLSVWTVMSGEHAAEYREVLIAAAEAGDFSEYTTETGIRVSLAIQGSEQANPDDDIGSPLARKLAGAVVDDDARAYELIMPEVEKLITRIDQYEDLWRNGWERIVKAVESFELGRSRVEELPESQISLFTLAPEIFSGGGFNPTRHAAPYTAISRYARGMLYVIGIPSGSGSFYRIDYPYYSWAETLVRPSVERRDFTSTLRRLNEQERNAGKWQLDNREMTSAIKFLDNSSALAISSQSPDEVAGIIAAESSRRRAYA